MYFVKTSIPRLITQATILVPFVPPPLLKTNKSISFTRLVLAVLLVCPDFTLNNYHNVINFTINVEHVSLSLFLIRKQENL